ncbi:uncharacterized protein A1O5_12110 [Cladophialophora psammophila CBS 110553]|uniref:Uncharacterized protein n=1 Tax=Cladophialophora psammophila CBS 110553 TaxID=1182543 RepID=W9W3B0_9EURO|nr:uncharacterized protein A1O5_12110 [Cladophialophora psammophila CBS 110553]EXJ59485.1 hypothetical protein A1O5_12110 [Cladophialophora psammophila CBS 110553]
MISPLLTLPYELRLQIWRLVLGPTEVQPCKCPSKPGTCKFNHPGSCCEGFDVDICCDNRLLRACRQIHDEVRPLLTPPKLFIVCNGLCMESLFLGIQSPHRRWIKRVRVDLYVGELTQNALSGLSGQELLQRAETCCGPIVQSALKCQGVGCLLDVAISEGSNAYVIGAIDAIDAIAQRLPTIGQAHALCKLAQATLYKRQDKWGSGGWPDFSVSSFFDLHRGNRISITPSKDLGPSTAF